MNSLSNTRRVWSIIFLFLFLAGCDLSCGGPPPVIKAPEVVNPSPPVPPGAEVSVSIEISSPDPVLYQWRTEEGGGEIVQGGATSAATWRAPQQEGTYHVYVNITIAGVVTEKSVAIKVETAPTPTPTLRSPPTDTPTPTPTDPTLPAESIAIISWVQGTVKVQRYEERLIRAAPGLVLFAGDVVTSLEESQAHLYCLGVGLFKLRPGRAVEVTCRPESPDGLELILAELPTELDNLAREAADDAPPTLAALETVRGLPSRSLADLGQLPILLSPRQLTLESRPTFRWTAVTDAEAYTLKVEGLAGSWETTLTASELTPASAPLVISGTAVLETVYPAQAPPLESGIDYYVSLQAHLPGAAAPPPTDETPYFNLMDTNTAAAVTGRAAQIQKLAAPDEAKAYLLALLYRRHGLWLAAIEPLEQLARRSPASPPLLPLGELYLRAGLTDLARANYQRALESAQADGDSYTQAAALTGLGQVAYAAQSDAAQAAADAVDFLQRALALYRELKADQPAEEVETLLAELKK
ncbi:MAG: tetratricopeptide repeat protein [Chloroflexota bacterium]